MTAKKKVTVSRETFRNMSEIEPGVKRLKIKHEM